METNDINDLMNVLNKCIKFKDSNNKQNVRRKLKKNDETDILTQLAKEYHKLLIETQNLKQIIINDCLIKSKIEEDIIYE